MNHLEYQHVGSGLPKLLAGAGMGLAMMYFFDPYLGKRRRSFVRDQVVHAWSKGKKAADVTARDVSHRIHGSYAELRSMFSRGRATDDVVRDRVRSRMGRYISHPSAIDVRVHNGCATLRGPIFATEEQVLLAVVQSVPGVELVENRLEKHAPWENVSDLHGGVSRTGEQSEWMQRQWSPTARLIAGTAGGAMFIGGLNRSMPLNFLLGTFGFGLCLRALANVETRRLLGLGAARRGIDLQKTITFRSPITAVFSLLANPENYPRFSDTVTSVRKTEENCFEKKLRGPFGTEITLHEIITRNVPQEILAWRSGPNSEVKYAGIARFESTPDGDTRVHIRMTYNPPGGVLSHTAARLLGFDPKTLWDEVLLRAKTYLETGSQPHDAADQRPSETSALETVSLAKNI